MNMQDVNTAAGQLQIRVTSKFDALPVEEVKIRISCPGDPDHTPEELTTNSSGMTETIKLGAPPADYSLIPDSTNQPYSIYTLEIAASGFETITINGVQILASVKAIQDVQLTPEQNGRGEYYVIPDHTLYSICPPKIAEDEIKPVSESGGISFRRMVIPEFIIVHDGPPADKSAQNYYVRYRDYIKNAVSCEIYATWPDAAIRANILAINSFTLNRVYTDYYRNKAYDFTITSSAEHDQKWIPNRNVYNTISDIVDELFQNYLSRPNVRQPILTQYCDGQRVACPNWMTKWDSKVFSEQGYSPTEILCHFYGNDMYINIAEGVSGVPSAWPGSSLMVGSIGTNVQSMQEQLNTVAKAYPALPFLTADGKYGPKTAAAVRAFQELFGMSASGEINHNTWYHISHIYTALSRGVQIA